MSAENIKVAVRVRGFNDRERAEEGACVVEMNGNQVLLNPNSKDARNANERSFAFDYSFWSFDGYTVEGDGYCAPDPSHPNGRKYCDQKKVYTELGTGVLENAWNGYNASVFAYGQTGSGKTYTMFGDKNANKGLVPNICDHLFEQIKDKQTKTSDQYEVTFTMIEVYNEIIRDLLCSSSDRKGLQLHERPNKGFEILEKDLKPIPIFDYASFEKLMLQGSKNKAVGATKMNETSSRSHTIYGLTFKQTFKNEVGKEMQRVSKINLIDLAGSERIAKTEATGQRLKEGVAINLSLTSLGNVISALASQASGKNVKVPYRDSVLTKLLMNALGGNSKTLMVANISPSSTNYEETLSTLRYADRAKQIKCHATVNEDPKDKLIRELQDEISQLKSKLSKGGTVDASLTDEMSKAEIEKMKKEMEENLKKQIENSEKEILAMKQSYEDKLAEAQRQAKEISKQGGNINEKSAITPHLSNISQDPSLTGSIKHLLELNSKKSKVVLGASEKVDIQLYGLGVTERHCCISIENDKFYLEPYANSRVVRNGKQVEQKFKMENLDRYVFGTSLYYIFVNPGEFTINGEKSVDAMNAQVGTITFEKVQQEIAEESGLITEADINRSRPEEIACLHELIDLMPHVEDANQMSIVLDKKLRYKPIILNPLMLGLPYEKVKPVIVVRKFGTALEWLWDKEKFVDRKAYMSEAYLDIKEDGKIDKEIFKTFDPFVESEATPVMIGTAVVEPKALLHRVPITENIKVFDYKSKLVGTLNIEILPCDNKGAPYKNIADIVVHKPETQLKKLSFLIKINNVKCLTPKYKNIYCQYKVFGDQEYVQTTTGVDTSNPDIKHERVVVYENVDAELLKFYSKQSVFIQVYGVQKPMTNDSNKKSTKEWFDSEKKPTDNSTESLKEEIKKLQAELDKAKAKLKNVETLLDFAEKKNKKKIRVEYVRECILSQQPDIMTKLMDKLNQKDD